MKKRYGDTTTHLHLTDKARRYYDGADQISIFEHEDMTYSYIMSSNGRPTTSSGPESRRMTEAELNAELEAMADSEEEYDDDAD